jgi:hypothetical protein
MASSGWAEMLRCYFGTNACRRSFVLTAQLRGGNGNHLSGALSGLLTLSGDGTAKNSQ